ncbi:lipopolysaccharide biosynthesis protein [Paludibaculum fermentans]|uniref:lipopolysaccharide biosynthesis protein n=1 Tax=Paludibaculum fermentans TaxID=1473598 RepID=UPI003EBBB752
MARIIRDIAGNVLAGVLARVIASVGPLVLVPLMVRTWGMNVYGEWLILTAIPAYVMLAPDFGLAGAVVNRMAFLTAGGHEEEAIHLYRSSWLVLICAALGFVGIGWGVAWLVDWRAFGVKALPHPAAAALIGWSCVQIFVLQQGFLLSGIYRSAGANPRWGMMSSLGSAMNLAAGAAALTLGGTPHNYLAAQLLAQVSWLCIVFRDSRRIMPQFTLALEGVSLRKVRPYILPGLGHAGMPLVNALQNQGVLLVLGTMLGSTAVGAFQTLRIVANGMKSVVGQLSNAIAVEVPALLGQRNEGLIMRIMIRNSQIGLAIVLAGITVLTVAGERLYRIWVGPTAHFEPRLMTFLLLSLIPYVIGASFSVLLLASNQIHLAIVPLLVTAGVSITMVGVCARNFGLVGPGMAILAWETCLALIVAAIAASRMRFSIRSYLVQCFEVRALLRDIQHMVAKGLGHPVRQTHPAKPL